MEGYVQEQPPACNCWPESQCADSIVPDSDRTAMLLCVPVFGVIFDSTGGIFPGVDHHTQCFSCDEKDYYKINGGY